MGGGGMCDCIIDCHCNHMISKRVCWSSIINHHRQSLALSASDWASGFVGGGGGRNGQLWFSICARCCVARPESHKDCVAVSSTADDDTKRTVFGHRTSRSCCASTDAASAPHPPTKKIRIQHSSTHAQWNGCMNIADNCFIKKYLLSVARDFAIDMVECVCAFSFSLHSCSRNHSCKKWKKIKIKLAIFFAAHHISIRS